MIRILALLGVLAVTGACGGPHYSSNEVGKYPWPTTTISIETLADRGCFHHQPDRRYDHWQIVCPER